MISSKVSSSTSADVVTSSTSPKIIFKCWSYACSQFTRQVQNSMPDLLLLMKRPIFSHLDWARLCDEKYAPLKQQQRSSSSNEGNHHKNKNNNSCFNNIVSSKTYALSLLNLNKKTPFVAVDPHVTDSRIISSETYTCVQYITYISGKWKDQFVVSPNSHM